MIGIAGMPAFSRIMASSKLPDEHAPQSPTPAMTKSVLAFEIRDLVVFERRALVLVHQHFHFHAVRCGELFRHLAQHGLGIFPGVIDKADAQAVELCGRGA